MIRRLAKRGAFGVLIAVLLGVLAASPAQAYGGGQANWQLTFAGTGPGFGFWGWCALSGATAADFNGLPSSGTTGDCQFSEYAHFPGFSGTCEISMDLTAEGGQPAWQIQPSSFTHFDDFFFSGTFLTHPSSPAQNLTAFCEQLPGSPPANPYSDFDSLLPAIPGHTNASGFFGTTELQIQETPAG